MYVLTVQITVKPERAADFMCELSALRRLIECEPECLRFDVLQNMEQPASIVLNEAWTRRGHFEQAQIKRLYYAPCLERVQPMWAHERRMQRWHAIVAG